MKKYLIGINATKKGAQAIHSSCYRHVFLGAFQYYQNHIKRFNSNTVKPKYIRFNKKNEVIFTVLHTIHYW